MTTISEQEVSDAVIDVCADTLRLPKEKFVPKARFVQDLEVDSLYVVQLAIALEERFEIQMSEDDSRSLVTVQDMVDLIYRKLTTGEEVISPTERTPPLEPNPSTKEAKQSV